MELDKFTIEANRKRTVRKGIRLSLLAGIISFFTIWLLEFLSPRIIEGHHLSESAKWLFSSNCILFALSLYIREKYQKTKYYWFLDMLFMPTVVFLAFSGLGEIMIWIAPEKAYLIAIFKYSMTALSLLHEVHLRVKIQKLKREMKQ